MSARIVRATSLALGGRQVARPEGALIHRSQRADSRYLKAVDRHNEWTVSAFLATNGELSWSPA